MYIEVILTVKDTAEAEKLIAALIDLGYEGFEERASSVAAYIDKELFNPLTAADLAQKFNSTFSATEIAEQNWNKLWESNYEPVQVGNFAGVRAGFHEPLQNVKYELIITPKMSFGTGHHATTFMMMDWMQEVNFEGRKVLDMGTGTGVLAILAGKLGASSITAIDIDEWSIENARENFENNGCAGTLLLQADTLETNESYDIILANINLNVILALFPRFRDHLSAGGLLLISGILKDDEPSVKVAAKEAGFDFIALKDKNNWLSVAFKKR